ncbi:Ribosomal L18p/L5e family protein [Rhynchospora pubera]|uniref:Ribosomal L18p/L5e family protein n=1 Tax=Rhynchospora pubera TaxID=906938 RepID=A0AAV8CQC8_9POAL|nr:Ribosomal L18p/L5e family protein [Rhynchospora pubera]
MDRASRHLLRLVVSCRKLSAEVSSPHSQTIIAMATSTEPEFALKQRALLARNPSSKLLWTPRTAVRVGEILANRLLGLGIDGVTVDLDEELARPPHWRRSLSPFFESVQRSGVRIDGAEKL